MPGGPRPDFFSTYLFFFSSASETIRTPRALGVFFVVQVYGTQFLNKLGGEVSDLQQQSRRWRCTRCPCFNKPESWHRGPVRPRTNKAARLLIFDVSFFWAVDDAVWKARPTQGPSCHSQYLTFADAVPEILSGLKLVSRRAARHGDIFALCC